MRKARIVRQTLRAKGFTEKEDGDHRYFLLFYNGKKSSIFTKISHSISDIGDSLCSQMAKQMRLTNPEFGEFVECKLSGEAYLKKMLADGHLILGGESGKPEGRS